MLKPPCLRPAHLVALSLLLLTYQAVAQGSRATQASAATLLTDPFLQLPTEDSVRVVWFTEFAGSEHYVLYGEGLRQRARAETEKMSRLAEDGESRVGAQVEDEEVYPAYTPREVWRHEATVTGLSRERRVPYTVTSVTDGAEVTSGEFTLGPLPVSGQPLKILLTSDHQLKEMTPANLQKVEETVGRVDAVFFAGDLVNIPDRASEWFDDNRGFAFFPSLQGRASYPLERTREDGTVAKTTYKGGELIQHAPLFPVIGNHEVMGGFSPGTSLGDQFNDPHPRTVARERYRQNAGLYNPQEDPEVRRRWLLDNSFNTLTYEELFTLPEDGSGGEQYYAVQFGDVYLIGL